MILQLCTIAITARFVVIVAALQSMCAISVMALPWSGPKYMTLTALIRMNTSSLCADCVILSMIENAKVRRSPKLKLAQSDQMSLVVR